MGSLAESGKLLLFQLTDVMNSGITFRDSENTVLEDYGTLPLLLRRGRIGAALRRGAEKAVKVRALDMAGRRTAELPCRKRRAAGISHSTTQSRKRRCSAMKSNGFSEAPPRRAPTYSTT